MQSQQRRVFMIQAVASATGLATSASVWADATAVPVKETDAYPKSMGFKLDTKDVDKKKFPRHEASQKCSECQLFSGKAGEALGPCSFFKRMVPPDGWCRNFKQRKAGA